MKIKKVATNENGITLVALVITIIIIIILATVAINFAFGNNGLIKRAEDARDFYANDTAYTDESITNVESYLNDILAGVGENTGTGGETEPEEPDPEEPKVPTTTEEAKPNEGEDGPKFTDTTPITDDEGNKVVIPGGFHLDEDSGTAVEDGIVIEDDSGNQFVWIPVGTYQTSSGAKTNNLSRRTFTSTGATEVDGDSVINSWFYGEGDGGSVARDTIGDFKDSVTTNGGFYVGRYEQGTGNVCKAGVEPYVDVTRDEAKTQSEAMYSGNSYVTSELISSYAWDTALNFICQTNSEGYTLAATGDAVYGNMEDGSKQNTGIYSADNYSNIHDLLGNCMEWTTEYCDNGDRHGVYRGNYYKSSNKDAFRADDFPGISETFLSFRIQLYVK